MRFSSPDYSLVLRTSAENTLKCIIYIVFARTNEIGTDKVYINNILIIIQLLNPNYNNNNEPSASPDTTEEDQDYPPPTPYV